ncbi:MAG: hypothetical protein HKN56_06465 [Gammaproteobacteria bacterium]|nr:hypothetical protein [Gammaproteobacteria bacterium]
MLGDIRKVTITASDLDAVESAYTRFLEYRVTARGKVSTEEAAAWGTPAQAGSDSLTLQPAAADDFEFRFVNAPASPDYVPLTTYGWNASEIMVQNVDAMAEVVADSPFEIVGEPRNLSFSDDIRAMQLRGPADEIIYLTEFKNPVPGLTVPTARSAVDRTFIVILGGATMDGLQDFYHDTFSVPKAPVVESRVTMLSKALGVSIETLYPIAALGLAGESLIEVDEMPDQVGPRIAHDGYLPPGIAMVGFSCDALPPAATAVDDKTSVMRGVTGELIELFSS